VKRIFIHNFRAGFATNSSSSHSVVLLPPGVQLSDDPSDDSNGYGWDFFRLVSEEQKLRYLAAQFFSQHWEDPVIRHRLVERFKQELPDFELNADDEKRPLYVDHQSVLNISANPAAVESMIKLFRSDRVAVLGGNDNTDRDYPEELGLPVLPVIRAMDRWNTRTRIDNDAIIVFSRTDGSKVRFSISEMSETPSYTKGSAPELCDVKITDFCAANCAFCYQSSTTKGRHAAMDDITKVADMCRDMGVFEVAIGGGEPTEHPDFASILRSFTSRDIVPNFTTFSDKWLGDEKLVKAVSETVGGIGVSCLDAKGLDLVARISAAMMGSPVASLFRSPRIMAQHVFGSVPLHVTAEFLRAAFDQGIPVLLLGYKDVGFGANYRRHDADDAGVFLKLALSDADMSRASLSVDTAFVDKNPGLLEALSIPEALVSSPEGKFSCYVDAVEGLMGPSSYIPKQDMTPLAENTEAFIRQFATY
jgi:hypothetical protein